MNYFQPPDPGVSKWCGVCGGAWPDGHRPNCPVLTGEAQVGQIQTPSSLAQQLSQQAAQGLMGQGFTYMVEFVGGPLDGHNPVHPTMNYRLQISGDDSGYYEALADCRYHWISHK